MQACGDCHLSNFGGFATPERKVVFDLNDFDETAIAPWEWDVKRLVASFVVAGRANCFRASACRDAAWWAARRYREQMAEYAGAPVLTSWYAAIDLEALVTTGTDEDFRLFTRRRVLESTTAGEQHHELTKLTHQEGDAPRITDAPPLIYHLDDVRKHRNYYRAIERSFHGYRLTLEPSRQILLDRYRLVDVAIKVVGVGSVGTECGVALLMSGNGEPLFLQFKEARESVLEPYAGRSAFDHRGRRVVVGQRIMAPFTAFQILQGIETLPLRMARHVENTRKVVAFLAAHPVVATVGYPELDTHPDRALAQRLLPQGCGAVFSFELKGTRAQGRQFIESLRLFSHLANVGDAKSLVIHPASTTHFRMSADELARAGIAEGTIRLSIGLEHPDDLIEDLSRALYAAGKAA